MLNYYRQSEIRQNKCILRNDQDMMESEPKYRHQNKMGNNKNYNKSKYKEHIR